MQHSEHELEERCVRYARQQGVLAVKLEKNAHTGIPDRLFIFQGGAVIFVEFKKGKGGRVSRFQKQYLSFLYPRAYIIDNFDDFVVILHEQITKIQPASR